MLKIPESARPCNLSIGLDLHQAWDILIEKWPSFAKRDIIIFKSMLAKFIIIARQIPDIGASIMVIHSALSPRVRYMTAIRKELIPIRAMKPNIINLLITIYLLCLLFPGDWFPKKTVWR